MESEWLRYLDESLGLCVSTEACSENLQHQDQLPRAGSPSAYRANPPYYQDDCWSVSLCAVFIRQLLNMLSREQRPGTLKMSDPKSTHA